jgi:hypothetical protein
MAIGFIGAGAAGQSTTSGATVTAAWPTGYTAIADHVAIVIASGKHNNGTTLSPTTPTGMTLAGSIFHELGTYDQQITVWYMKLAGSEAARTTTVPAGYSTTSGGLQIQVLVYSGVDTTTQIDATAVTSTGAAAATFTPTGITTATAGARVLSCVLTADDNTLNFGGAGNSLGYSPRISTNYTAGGDNCHAIADAEFDAAGAKTCPTWNESTVGDDAWCAVTLALRPASYTGVIPGPHMINQSVNRSAVY